MPEVLLDSVAVASQQVTDLHGKIRKLATSPIVRVDDVLGKIHGGQAAGFAEFRLASPLQYNVSLRMEDVDLAAMFKAAGGEKAAKDVKGLLDGNIQLIGSGTDMATCQAVGVLRISKAKLYKLPLMLGLLHVIYLSVPGDAAFTEGELNYHLKGDQLTLREINLRGPAISILGSGTINVKKETLNLTFLTGPPGKLPAIRSLATELLEGISRAGRDTGHRPAGQAQHENRPAPQHRHRHPNAP